VCVWYTFRMTTIIAVQHKESCIFAADSRTTGSDGRPYHHMSVAKVTDRDGWLIAGSGDAPACDLIQHGWKAPKQVKTLDNYKYMVTVVSPSIRKYLKDNGYEIDANDKESGFLLLLAYKGTIYEVDDTYTVSMRDDGLYGIGSGSKWALGALQAGATMDEALEIAARNDIYTAGPFISLVQFPS